MANKTLEEIEYLEALADLMIQKATELKNDCHKARRKLEGVSTSSVRKGQRKSFADIVARRNQRMLKQ